MINYDLEEYKEATSMELSIQHVHDGMTKLKCWSYSITRLPESKRQGIVLRCNHEPPESQGACWVEASIPLRSSG